MEKDKNFYKELKEYFKMTPREKVLEDWAKTAECDKVGPTVEEFLDNTSRQLKNIQKNKEIDEYYKNTKPGNIPYPHF
jgi:hypothetical protein